MLANSAIVVFGALRDNCLYWLCNDMAINYNFKGTVFTTTTTQWVKKETIMQTMHAHKPKIPTGVETKAHAGDL